MRKIAVLAALAFALAVGLSFVGPIQSFELKAYDLFSRRLNPEARYPDIVSVEVDQQSIDDLSGQAVTWPWPRQVYAPIIEQLAEADAVFVDILFLEPSSYGHEDDLILAEAMKKAGNVYLPVFLSTEKASLTQGGDDFLRRIAVDARPAAPLPFTSARLAIDELSNAAAGGGNVAIMPDRDSVYRRVPLFFRIGDKVIPCFVLDYLLKKQHATMKGRQLLVGTSSLRGDGPGLLIRYAPGEPITRIPAADVIGSYNDAAQGKAPAYTKEFFRGKKVFIGLTAAGLFDLKATPVRTVATGVTVHAAVLANLLRGDFIRPVSTALLLSFMLVLSLAAVWLTGRYHAVSASLVSLLGLLAVAIGVPALLFRSGFYLQILPPVVAALSGFILSVAYSYATEGKKRRFIKQTFSQYMDRKLVEHVLMHPQIIRPGGERRRVTVFFADIAGFTAMAEKSSPEDVAAVLHAILSDLTEVIIAHDGVIDKYIGDCIMAFWGAPMSTDDDEVNACRAAVRCGAAIEEINRRFAPRGLPAVRVRIGIHTGDAIVGNLGSDRLFDYTVVGDTVNLASRLESVNKVFGTRTICSADTFSRAAGACEARELGQIEVKGRSTPVRIFELVGVTGETADAALQIRARFQEGLALYRQQRFDAAASVFEQILQAWPEDGPSRLYRDRCVGLRGRVLTDGWDIIKMTEK